MLTIGITGPTGSGKTALLDRIAVRGGLVIDCDALYYALLQTKAELRAALEAAFGAVFLPDGTLDRQKLGALVFHDEAALTRLNEIVFFHVGRAVKAKLDAAREEGRMLAGVDAINLIESGLAELCDVTVAVTAPEQVRMARIIARDHLTQQYALSRIRAQKCAGYYEARCQYAITNDCASREEFSRRADELLELIMKENAS